MWNVSIHRRRELKRDIADLRALPAPMLPPRGETPESAGVEVTLDPGQAVDVLIFGTVAQYKAHVTYLVDIADGGDCAYCWGKDDWHNGHHDWARDAASVASSVASFPQEVTEIVKFGFASDGTIKVVDAQSGSLVGEQSFNVVPAENLPLRIDARTA